MIELRRTTKETDVYVALDVTSEERKIEIDTGCGFFDHMLELMAFHGGMSLTVRGKGDRADDHHLVEDVGILLGKVLLQSLQERDYNRYGWCLLPMDGSLAMVAIDLSGRGSLNFNVQFPSQKCGTFDLELVEEFWKAFSRDARATIHLKSIEVDNSHHIAEAIFKGAGQALRQALAPSGGLASTKGVLI